MRETLATTCCLLCAVFGTVSAVRYSITASLVFCFRLNGTGITVQCLRNIAEALMLHQSLKPAVFHNYLLTSSSAAYHFNVPME